MHETWSRRLVTSSIPIKKAHIDKSGGRDEGHGMGHNNILKKRWLVNLRWRTYAAYISYWAMCEVFVKCTLPHFIVVLLEKGEEIFLFDVHDFSRVGNAANRPNNQCIFFLLDFLTNLSQHLELFKVRQCKWTSYEYCYFQSSLT